MSAAALLLLLASGGGQYEAPRVPDPQLAGERGGFRLPNGIDVAMTVQTQTAVNGQVVLATVFRADQGPATTTTYVPKPGETVAAPATTGAAAAAMPTITYDKASGIQIARGGGAPTVTIAGAGAAGAVASGLTAIEGGNAVTDAGAVTQASRGGLTTTTLTGADLSVTHFAGNAFGSAIANAGSDRAISTETTLAIDLRGAGPDVMGSAMLRASGLADDAVRGRF